MALCPGMALFWWVWSLEELLKRGFKVIKWDGRTPHHIVDKEGRIFVALAGRPREDSGKTVEPWGEATQRAVKLFAELQEEGVASGAFKGKDLEHRRGKFLATAFGVSYGGGQKKPGNLVHTKKRRTLLRRVLGDRSVRRIAGFQSSALAFYAPKLFSYLQSTLRQLFEHHPGLQQNFKNSVYPAVTISAGPITECAEHQDAGNAANLMCAVTALGDFDPTKGGHLVLFSLGLVIEFPPGSTILLPSACVPHGNTPIGEGEIRMSMTQYCAGGLLRWVAYGFRSARSILGLKGGRQRLEELDGPPGSRWKWALELFSKEDELSEDQAKFSSW